MKLTHRRWMISVAIALLVISVAVSSVAFSPHAGTKSTAFLQDPGNHLIRVSASSNVANTSFVQGHITIVPVNNSSASSVPGIFITVSLNSSTSMSNELNLISNPAFGGYGTHLTPAGVSSQFGVPAAVYGKIENYFSSYGLKIYPDSTRISITAEGSPVQIDNAFHTTMHAFDMVYNSSGSWQPLFGPGSGIAGNVSTLPFYASTAPSYLPASIAGWVSGIAGLNGIYMQPSISLPNGLYPGSNFSSFQSTPLPSAASAVPASTSLYYLNGTYGYVNATEASSLGMPASNYQLLFPGTLPVLTGASNLWSGKSTVNHLPDMGQNVTVALIEVGLISPTIVNDFSAIVFHNSSQIANRLTQIPLMGATVASGTNYGWTLETALDIEYLATMAPKAHIDLVAIPSPSFSLFDYAYSYIAQNLVSYTNASTSVSITSNSYGAGEYATLAFGSPMYLTVENSMLEELALEGVTNFFASGDYGSDGTAAGAGMPAIASGSVSVGGGQLTAMSHGQVFPATGVYTIFNLNGKNVTLHMANATGVSSFSYWYYPGFFGSIAGGFGQSMSASQPWWQNALDTYSTGARIDPVISGAAAFNMTLYMNGWQMFYGGTSFATPITAGEWALIEEQVNTTLGMPSLGDVNPLLFDIHNAYQASGNSTLPSAYLHMSANGVDYNSYYVNSMSWELYNYSISYPTDPVLPGWFATLNNPAGSGWNYLQGLGMLNATTVTEYLTGNGLSAGESMLHMPFSIGVINASGAVNSFTNLTGSISYHFRITAPSTFSGSLTVKAYSGGTNEGTYAGGNTTTLSLTAGNLNFTYTPVYNFRQGTSQSPEYGSFQITTASGNWSFQFYSILPKPATGQLVIGASDIYGNFETSHVNVPMFSTTAPGQYTMMYPVTVMFDGQPVPDAMVVQKAVVVNYSAMDPFLNGSSYSPGATLGTYITDLRGSAGFWTNAMISTNDGPLNTQVFILQAEYQGHYSNQLTVYVEPQSGSYLVNAHIDNSTGMVSGNVTFNDMKYVSSLNITIQGSSQYTNVSFPLLTNDYGGLSTSNVSNGVVPFSFKVPSASAPLINISVVAVGANIVEATSFSAGTFTVVASATQNPIRWAFEYSIFNALVNAPVTSLSTVGNSTANGVVMLYYHTAGAPAGSTGELVASTSSVSTVIAGSLPVNGSYAWNTTTFADGNYTVTFVASTPSGLSGTSSISFYLDNNQIRIQHELKEISLIEGAIASSESKIATIRSEISAGNASVSVIKAQIAELNISLSNTSTEIASLAAMVGSSNATVMSMNSQVAYLREQVSQLNPQTSAPVSKSSASSSPFTMLLLLSLIAVAAVAGVAGHAMFGKWKQKRK